MKFTINSKVFLNRLATAGKVIINRPKVAILGSFLLELEGETITITASDGENMIVSRVEASQAEGTGRVCIDAKQLTKLLKTMPDCQVTFDISEKCYTSTITCPNDKYSLSGTSGDAYPAFSKCQEPKGKVTLSSSLILNAMDKVDFAVDNSKLHMGVRGVYWEIKDDAIAFVATDARVLAKYRTTQIAPGFSLGVIQPAKSIKLIRPFLRKCLDVQVVITDTDIFFKGPGFTVRSALCKERFPDYNRVIPINLPLTISFDRMDFINAINRVFICADKQFQALCLKIGDGKIVMMTQDTSYNVRGEEYLPCDYAQAPVQIGFSLPRLKKTINVISTQRVIMKMKNSNIPAMFLPVENDEYGELTILNMPMRTQGE